MNRSLRVTPYAFAVLAGMAATVCAELPPYVYQELQEKSPEALNIRVESVKLDKHEEPNFTRVSISAQAKVESVTRSASGLKPGDTIRINYSQVSYKRPVAGPSEPDILEKGERYPAFLSGTDGIYSPAARGYSFRIAR